MAIYDPIPEETKRALNKRGLLDERSVRHLWKAARDWKPSCYGIPYDEHQKRVRLLYEGKRRAVLSEQLAKVYPSTWRDMQQAGINLVRQSAEIDATVYDRPARRWIVRDGQRLFAEAILGEDDEEITPASESAKQFDQMIKRARLDMVMGEAEKRCNVARSLPIRVDVDRPGGRLVPQPFWPCDVWVVPFAGFPGEIRYALAIISRVSGGGAATNERDSQLFNFMFRPAAIGVSGDLQFGSWKQQYVDGKNRSYEPAEGMDWEGPAPWAMYHRGIPDGSPFVDVDRDIVDEQLTVSESWTNLFHILRHQAHDDTVLKSSNTKARTIVMGPGRHNQINVGEELEVISRNPKIREYEDSLDSYTTLWAKSRRQPEDAYSKEHAAPMTGVSRKIKERQYDKASRERELAAVVFEEEQLLPLMVEMSDRFLGTSIGAVGDEYRMTPAEPIEYEDPPQRDQRIDRAVDREEISEARGAVEKQLYPDEQTAAEMGLSRGIKQAAPEPEADPTMPDAPPVAAE